MKDKITDLNLELFPRKILHNLADNRPSADNRLWYCNPFRAHYWQTLLNWMSIMLI